jgi:SAM-dependent methyltransferase
MNRIVFLLCSLLVAFFFSIKPAEAESSSKSDRYQQVTPSSDGIGKSYFGREISAVMGWQGSAWLERQERNQEERTDLLIAALGLKPGLVVADIGAGTGYLSRHIAPSIMPGGKVWAVDIQPEMVNQLIASIKRSGLIQIEPRLCTVDNVMLPASSVDLVVMVDVYHELAFPYEVMSSIFQALKPGGRVVFVEYRAEDPNVPIKKLHKMSEEQIKREASIFPLKLERTIRTLPWQHVLVFRKLDNAID